VDDVVDHRALGHVKDDEGVGGGLIHRAPQEDQRAERHGGGRRREARLAELDVRQRDLADVLAGARQRVDAEDEGEAGRLPGAEADSVEQLRHVVVRHGGRLEGDRRCHVADQLARRRVERQDALPPAAVLSVGRQEVEALAAEAHVAQGVARRREQARVVLHAAAGADLDRGHAVARALLRHDRDAEDPRRGERRRRQ
jgi:hypothetical protein